VNDNNIKDAIAQTRTTATKLSLKRQIITVLRLRTKLRTGSQTQSGGCNPKTTVG